MKKESKKKPTTHHLKCIEYLFKDTIRDIRHFEYRKHSRHRPFKIGDSIILKEIISTDKLEAERKSASTPTFNPIPISACLPSDAKDPTQLLCYMYTGRKARILITNIFNNSDIPGITLTKGYCIIITKLETVYTE